MLQQPQKTSSIPRVIRVFISSTFRDMKEERDQLVKFIFPKLRRLCEQRGVTRTSGESVNNLYDLKAFR